MTVIYIDRVFALNLALDYMLLLICARLAGTPLRRLRFLLCAAGGAFYAAAVFLPGCAALNGPVFRLLAGLAMSLAAFWCEVRRWRLIALFFLVSGALAGLLLAVGLALGSPGKLLGRVYYARVSRPVLLGTALGMSLLLRLVFGQAARHGGNEIMSITISLGGKCCTVRALHDTGCTLRDPVTGGPVLVLERRALDPLWTPPVRDILAQPLPLEEKMARLHGEGSGRRFTLLPFTAVGTASGLLLAVYSDYIELAGRRHRRALLALSDGPLSDGGGYQALWGGEEGRSREKSAAAAAALDQSAQQAG